MKGKYATRADSTRARMDAQSRAESNEHRVRALEKQIGQMRVDYEKVLRGMKADLEAAVRDRDAQASPALVEARQRIRTLEAERDAMNTKIASIQKKWDVAVVAMLEWFLRVGMSQHEAEERLLAIFGERGITRVTGDVEERFGRTHGADAVRRVQAARGQRGADVGVLDVAEDVLSPLNAPVLAASRVHSDVLDACVGTESRR